MRGCWVPVPGGCWAVGIPQVLGMSLRLGTAPWLILGVVRCVLGHSRALSPHTGLCTHPAAGRLLCFVPNSSGHGEDPAPWLWVREAGRRGTVPHLYVPRGSSPCFCALSRGCFRHTGAEQFLCPPPVGRRRLVGGHSPSTRLGPRKADVSLPAEASGWSQGGFGSS